MSDSLQLLKDWADAGEDYSNCARILLGRIDKGELTPDAALALFFILDSDDD